MDGLQDAGAAGAAARPAGTGQEGRGPGIGTGRARPRARTSARRLSSYWTRLLEQTEVWHGREGTQRLEEMDSNHRANLIPFLRGNVTTIYRLAHGGQEPESPQAAEEWLVARPLMQRLLEFERERPYEDRQATHQRNRDYEAATGYQKVRLG